MTDNLALVDALTCAQRLRDTLAAQALATAGTLDPRAPGMYHDAFTAAAYLQAELDAVNSGADNNAALADLVARNMQLMSDNQACQQRVLDFQTANARLQQQLAALQNSMNSTQQANTSLQTQLTAANTKTASLQKERDSWYQQATALNRQIAQLEVECGIGRQNTGPGKPPGGAPFP